MEQFAFRLYREFAQGKSVEELARQTGIPVERIEQRLRAAELVIRQRGDAGAARQSAD